MKKSSFSAWIVLVTLISPLVLPQALSAASHTVEFKDFTFTPATLTVNVGDTVTFTNVVASGFHTVTGTGADPFCGEGRIATSCSVTFNTPGTFPYRCVFHSVGGATPTGMIGSITVNSSSTDKPNLVPFHLNGWSDSLVVSRAPGNHISDPDFFSDQDIFVDWAIANISLTAGIPNTFFTELVLDGVSDSSRSWSHNNGLPPDTFNTIEDFNLGKLPVGEHVLTLVTDHTEVVAESNEADNSYSVNVRVLKRPSGVVHTVEYSTGGANVFTPAKLTVNVGDSVLFLHGTGTIPHTITGTTAAEPFCGNAAVPSACSVTFNTPGIFPYRCLFHSTSGATPTGMVGSVTVLSPVSLETATNVEGPYVATPSAVINTTAHTVTVPAPLGRAFWRLRSDTALRITKVEIVSSTLVLSYQ